MPTQYPVATDESVTVQLVRALADAADVDPVELSPPLYDVVDPDALEALFAPTEGGTTRRGRVEFTYAEYRVTVDAAGDSDHRLTITVSDVDGDAARIRSREQAPERIHRQCSTLEPPHRPDEA
ncbi:HalOD1 output domain-containing protein [Halopiger thermotolerans]